MTANQYKRGVGSKLVDDKWQQAIRDAIARERLNWKMVAIKRLDVLQLQLEIWGIKELIDECTFEHFYDEIQDLKYQVVMSE